MPHILTTSRIPISRNPTERPTEQAIFITDVYKIKNILDYSKVIVMLVKNFSGLVFNTRKMLF